MLKDIYNWKNIKSQQYDIVISGQVFEHVEYMWVTILEIARVLKDDGICCIIAPSSGNEHKYPVDCWRFYPDGFRALTKYAGLNKLEVYTQWNKELYPEFNPVWKDSVLICKKPKMKKRRKLKFWIKNKLSKIIIRLN
jgi:SAM-dependent methyltransferase